MHHAAGGRPLSPWVARLQARAALLPARGRMVVGLLLSPFRGSRRELHDSPRPVHVPPRGGAREGPLLQGSPHEGFEPARALGRRAGAPAHGSTSAPAPGCAAGATLVKKRTPRQCLPMDGSDSHTALGHVSRKSWCRGRGDVALAAPARGGLSAAGGSPLSPSGACLQERAAFLSVRGRVAAGPRLSPVHGSHKELHVSPRPFRVPPPSGARVGPPYVGLSPKGV